MVCKVRPPMLESANNKDMERIAQAIREDTEDLLYVA